MNEHAFAALLDTLAHDDEGYAEWSYPFLDALAIDGASVATFGPVLAAETVSATDRVAGRLDEAQFDLGEGPCWDALRNLRPGLHPDMSDLAGTSWPAFSAAILPEFIGAVFVFPLHIGPLQLGSVDLYTRKPHVLSALDVKRAVALTAATSRLVLRRALRDNAAADNDVGQRAFPRRVIHQATGMVMSQLRIRPDDSYLLIQGHAFATGRSMESIAASIVQGTLTFTATEEGIQDRT